MKKKNYFLPISILIAAILIVGAVIYNAGQDVSVSDDQEIIEYENLVDKVIPENGVVLPIKWEDLGMQMIQAGVIDASLFETLYKNRGGLTNEDRDILYGSNNEYLLITQENSGMILNMLWAFGLSNKNEILEQGPMVDKKYGGNPNDFASVGGWPLAVGDPMDHYSKHLFVSLTKEQQEKVENVSKGIFRPCCGNSTHFPDCNHGMAMLGLLELLASNGVSEDEMYDIALAVNSYWFPDTYMMIASYFEKKGTSWDVVNPRIALSNDYSSNSGYQQVIQEMEPLEYQGGGGCSV